MNNDLSFTEDNELIEDRGSNENPKLNNSSSAEGSSAEGSSDEGSSDEGSSSSSSSSSSSASSSYEIFEPPESRVLPQRLTRGKRGRDLAGSDEELDRRFWGDEVWREESEDDEWSTEDEKHYRDKFDSDFLDDEDEEEDAEEEERELQARAAVIDRRQLKEVKKFDYQKVAENRAKRRKTAQSKQWSALDVNRSGPIRGRKGKQQWTQDDHMKEARRIELLRVKEENTLEGQLIGRGKRPGTGSGTTPGRTNQHKSEDRITAAKVSELELWISWASDRKIEAEEQRKTTAQRIQEATEPIRERQLLFFINMTDPKLSRIPNIYATND